MSISVVATMGFQHGTTAMSRGADDPPEEGLEDMVPHANQTCSIGANSSHRDSHGITGAGCSSIDSVPAFEAIGRRIDPSQWTQLQFGLFSVPTSGPQLVYQRPWYVLFCLWKTTYKRSLAAYRKE